MSELTEQDLAEMERRSDWSQYTDDVDRLIAEVTELRQERDRLRVLVAYRNGSLWDTGEDGYRRAKTIMQADGVEKIDALWSQTAEQGLALIAVEEASGGTE